MKRFSIIIIRLVYTTQVNSAFGMHSLAGSKVIIQVYSPPCIKWHAKLQKSIIFQVFVKDKVVFGTIFSTSVVHTKTIIHLGVSESGGYLPCHFAAQQLSTNIHLHLNE